MRDQRRLGWVITSVFACASACGGPSAFSCEDASACVSGAQIGFCEPNGYCSFPDESCPSGRRYGEHAITGLAGQCVPLDNASDTDDALDSTTTHGDETTLESDSSAGPSGPSSTTLPTDTTGDPTDPTDPTVSTADDDTTHGMTGPHPIEVEIPADIAECTDPVGLDPVACANADDGSSINVDGYDSAFGGPTMGWLRFSIPQELAALEVTSVRLRLVVTDHANADGDAAGEIWSVSPFDLATLTASQPSKIELLAASFGPVAHGDVAIWTLPVTAVSTMPVHLGIFPVSDNGVNYWNNDGTDPPVLIVEAQ